MPPLHTFSTDVITSLTALEQLAPEWDDLWHRCPGLTPFQRPEWVLSWTQTFRPERVFVIVVRRQKTLVGLAPLFLYHSGEAQILAPLAASVSDYLDWLIDPSASSQILDDMFDVLGSADVLWHQLNLTDIPSTSPLLKLNLEEWDCQRSVETVCPGLTLPPNARSVEDILSAKPRHNLRTARRRTAKAGDARIEIANEATLPEFLTAMMHLHAARWTDCGGAGVLAEDRVQDFHRRAAPALLRRGVLRLYGFRLNGELIATLYAMAEPGTVYCYLQGFDPAYSALSPGAQILAAVIDDALENGRTTVDFLRGREAYKYLWGAHDQQTYRLCLRQRTSAHLSDLPKAAA